MAKKLLLLILLVCGITVFSFSQDDSTYQNIEEVVISSKRKKKIVFEDPKYFIVDFAITADRTFLLMKNLGKYYLYELDENMQFLSKLRIKMNANGLFNDCFGNTHLVTKDSTYFILNDSMGLFLTETHPRKEFLSAMEKCMGQTTDKYVFHKRSFIGDHHTYYTIDADSGYRNIVYEVIDSSGILGANGSAMASREYNQTKKGLFQKRIRSQKYNPLFVVDDTLYAFNHVDGKSVRLDDLGNQINSLNINHQKKKGWKRRIYDDKSIKRFYAVRMKNGVETLIGLALTDEEQNFSCKITKHAYPEKVIVRNGYAYYTYKPNVDANLNKLYRHKL